MRMCHACWQEVFETVFLIVEYLYWSKSNLFVCILIFVLYFVVNSSLTSIKYILKTSEVTKLKKTRGYTVTDTIQ